MVESMLEQVSKSLDCFSKNNGIWQNSIWGSLDFKFLASKNV